MFIQVPERSFRAAAPRLAAAGEDTFFADGLPDPRGDVPLVAAEL
jgi:hypothetical protein